MTYLINSKIFKPEDFTPPDERGGVYLHPDALKRFLKHWEDRLLTEVIHPHTGYKVNHRRCFELQVWEYIACLSGDRAIYEIDPQTDFDALDSVLQSNMSSTQRCAVSDRLTNSLTTLFLSRTSR